MKRASICLFLVLIMIFPMLPCRVQAAANIIICRPGETIKIFFMLSEEGDQPDGVMGRLSYNTDIFTLLPSGNIIGMDGINILNREPVAVSFRVNLYAPAGEYTIEVKVIEAYDADGKQYTNARVSPVQVTVEPAADNPLPSADSAENKQIKAGDYVTFGRYPQTAEGNDMTPIEWLVLEVQGNKALLLSRYGLDVQFYSSELTLTEEGFEAVTWETCTLRTWLSEKFLGNAFTAQEQMAILTTEVDNSRSQGYDWSQYDSNWKNMDGGNNTEDKIFLLSFAEADKYLEVEDVDNNKNPTAYALKQANVKMPNEEDYYWWWLRSPGYEIIYAAIVNNAHHLGVVSCVASPVFVRPAMWVCVDAISK